MKTIVNDHDLERLFEKVLQQPPLLDDMKMRSLLNNAPEQAFSGGSIKQFIYSHLNSIVMSIVISSIVIGTLVLHNKGQRQENESSSVKIKTDIMKAEVVQTAVKSNKGFVVHQFEPPEYQNKDKSDHFSTIKSDRNVLSNIAPAVKEADSVPDVKPVSGEEYILDLTNEKLKKLGVLNTDSGLYYLNITPDGMMSEYCRPYDNEATDGKGNYFKIRNGNSENVLSVNTFYVYYSTNEQVFGSVSNHISVSVRNSFKLFYPLTRTEQSLYYRSDSSNSLKKLFAAIDSIPKDEGGKYISNFIPKLLKNRDDTLVPVIVHLLKPDLFGEKTKILWFISDSNFYNALPESHREKTKKFFETNKELKKKYHLTNIVDYNSVYEDYDFFSKYTNFIDLTREELLKLGIRFKKDTNEYRAGLEYRDIYSSLLFCKKSHCLISGIKSRKGQDTIVKPALYASYYSYFEDKILNEMPSRFRNNEQCKINELIPVRVKKNMPDNYMLDDDIIFWFAATEAFFDSLPARIGDELKRDYTTIMMRRDPKISLEEKLNLSSTCKYFEECKATLFDVNFTVFPNPITENINIDLELFKPEKISVSVYSLTGRLLQTLQPMTSMPAGAKHLTFSASNLHEGFFIITFQNSLGLTKSQRIIKLH
jgi:hypothetical protein